MTRFATILMLAGAVPALAACGSSNPSTQSAATKASQAIAYSKCMRSHGVPNFPDFGTNGNAGFEINASARSGSGQTLTINGVPISAPAFQSASHACQALMPKPKPIPGGLEVAKKNGLKFAECMRSHGVPNFPDPQIQSGPGGGIGVRIGGPNSGIDPKSPAFQSAQKACGHLFGGIGPKVQAPAG